jgi:eukaryotic-like serine/threonine-protein kinase
VLAIALVASLIALVVVLQVGSAGNPRTSPRATQSTATAQAHKSPAAGRASTAAPERSSALPPTAAAAAAFTGELTAAVADGQVTQQAGQGMFNQLQQLLFRPQGENQLQVQQQYQQLVQVYDQELSQGQITGSAVSRLRLDLQALGNALGAL